jgi:hypothetical protein
MGTSRSVLIRDYAIFLVKLFLDGAKDGILVALASVAVVGDILSPDRKQKFFYSVMRLGERFDLWLNLHGALEKGQDSGDGLFGGSAAGSDTLLGQLEQYVRGGDVPGGRHRPSGKEEKQR